MRYRIYGAGALLLVTATAVLWAGGGRADAQTAVEGESAGRAPVTVALTSARRMHFAETVATSGSLDARFYAVVAPRIEGVLDRIPVREGDTVEAGKTVLFQTDNVNLAQRVELAREELATAETSLEEKKAQLALNAVDVAQAKRDLDRTVQLHDQKVVTEAAREHDETAHARLLARRRVDEANVALAEREREKAQINLTMAEKNLRDSVMLAPIGGVVSKRFVEPGEMGRVGTAVVRLDDTRRLKAVAMLPGAFYARVKVGETRLTVRIGDREIGRFPVSYRAPAIDAAYRTFEVWAYLEGDGEWAVPGAQALVEVILEERDGVGVPRDAVQRRGGKDWIFVADGGAVRRVEVVPGLEADDWVELPDAPFPAGTAVVTQGQFLLADGDPIREMAEAR